MMQNIQHSSASHFLLQQRFYLLGNKGKGAILWHFCLEVQMLS